MRDYLKMAKKTGFTAACYFNPQEYSFADAALLREACEANDCGMYGKFWTCPPGIGSIEHVINLVKGYEYGLILQLLTEAINYAIQPEVFSEICTGFNQMTKVMGDAVAADVGEVYLLGMSGCTLCETCTYPDKKCRYPQAMIPCISSHCLNIYRLWDSSGQRRAALDESDYYSILLWRE